MYQSQAFRKDFEFDEFTCFIDFFFWEKYVMTCFFFWKQEVTQDTMQCNLKFSDLFEN